jgi:DNA transformation protein
MPYSNDYLQYVLEQLGSLRGATSRRMFGCAGLYHEELFFGLIDDDVLYLRVNEENRPDYEALGMSRFRPYKDKPYLSFNYYEVPAHVLEDADELVSWARRSLKAATAPDAQRTPRAKRKPRAERKAKGQSTRPKRKAKGHSARPERNAKAQSPRPKPTARKK